MIDRRTFVVAGAGLSILKGVPNDVIRTGVIGTGGRGTAVMSVFQKQRGVEIGAVCDVYEPNLERAISLASHAGGKAPTAYRHYTELLRDKNVDVVLIATPEHWHHRMVLDALSAGKDVYVEKPLCHTPEEGVELVNAEKQTKQIVQVGMQRRSYDLFLEARKVMESDALGHVRMVRSYWLNNYLNSPKATSLDGKLDWEQWQGPAKKTGFDADRFRNWRYYSDYSGGILADQGAHVFDGIHMLLGAGSPRAVTAAAGRPHKAEFDTPESVTVTAAYREDFIATFSINYAAMKYKPQNDQLNQLDGDKARLDIGREEWKLFEQGSEETAARSMKSERGFAYATELHVANFIDCVRTRKRPTAPMEVAFRAALAIQMANLSIQHRRQVIWNETAQKVEMS